MWKHYQLRHYLHHQMAIHSRTQLSSHRYPQLSQEQHILSLIGHQRGFGTQHHCFLVV
ncbi:hypothetical protein MtrunA17_Chr4g0038991 [Medicago truncatula]|uniref:Uncharacterized protein n=1 Tax=Medicago truncatula TaxID=3880 RepID=I3S9P3_MEDTR|nr:unknown [Medicago truncatula]RHN61654.1 hypothetical protein MtrunA17_Chr4g0038991 [Medicago truncatula]